MPEFPFKFGRVEPAIPHEANPAFLRLRDFLVDLPRGFVGAEPPKPPATSDRTGTIPKAGWGNLGNDRYGNCVLAGEAHWWMALASETGGSYTVDEPALIKLYLQLSPGDRGLIIADTLGIEQKTGLLGEKIIGYVAIDKKADLIKIAIHEFCGAKLGVMVPNSAMRQFSAGQPWVYKGDAGTYAHDIEAQAYDANYVYCVTWGKLVPVEWRWLAAYWSEGFARVSARWLDKSGVTPTGLNVTKLLEALDAIGDGPPPNPVDPPKPPPMPDPPRPPIDPPSPSPADVVVIDPANKVITAPRGWMVKTS